MNALQEEQFESDYDKFLEGGLLFTARDSSGRWTLEEGLGRLRFYTKLFCDKNNSGYSSLSAFRIVADALAADTDPAVKIVSMVKDRELEEAVPDLTAEEYRRIPVREIQRKYQSDPDFKRQVEKLIANGEI